MENKVLGTLKETNFYYVDYQYHIDELPSRLAGTRVPLRPPREYPGTSSIIVGDPQEIPQEEEDTTTSSSPVAIPPEVGADPISRLRSTPWDLLSSRFNAWIRNWAEN